MRRYSLTVLGFLALPFLAGWTPQIGDPPTAKKKPSAAKKLGVVGSGSAARNWKTSLFVEPTSREAARVFYRTVYTASEGQPVEWTGNTDLGVAGTTAAPFKDATALRINWFRAMAGVPADITLDPVYSQKARKAALMMSANGKLSHYPEKTWTHYSDDGAEAASHSNLGLADNGPDAITSYVLDAGGNNAAVGHRRWLLYPATAKMGTGDVPKQGTHPTANALWVLDSASGPRPEVRDPLVAWPPKGFVPYGVVFARWSASLPGADFSKATVTMTRAGAPLGVTIESSTGGAGESSIVFRPDGMPSDGWGAHPRPASDLAYEVTIQNVAVDGKVRAFTYPVTVFDPAVAGTDTVSPVVNGSSTPKVGAQNPYLVTAVPRADGYRVQEARTQKLALALGAEAGLANLVAKTSPGYEPIAKDVAASGTASYHLAHPEPQPQTLEIDRTLLVGKGTSLSFKARLMWAAKGQSARLEAKREGSGAWQTVWTHPAVGTPDGVKDSGFSAYTVPLGAFDGTGLRLRFVYDHEGGSYYPSTSKVGFYIDDVSLSGDELVAVAERDAPGGAFTFAPPSAGAWVLRVRPRFYGKFFLEYGPAKVVEASTTAPTPPAVPTLPTPVPSTVPTTTPSSPAPSATPAPTIAWPIPIAWPPPSPSGGPIVITVPELPSPTPFPTPSALPIPLPIKK